MKERSMMQMGFVVLSAVLVFGSAPCVTAGDDKAATPADLEPTPTESPIEADDVTWRTLAGADFTDGQPIRTPMALPGVAWDFSNGVARASGITRDHDWRGTRIEVPVDHDDGNLVEVSGEFKIVRSDGYQLIALFGAEADSEPLCMYFEGRSGGGSYHIQTRWMNRTARLLNGSLTTQGFGDEMERFHRMRMVLNRDRNTIDYYVDQTHLGTIGFDKPVGTLVRMQMDLESNHGDTTLEILYDNLLVRSGADRGGGAKPASPEPVAVEAVNP